MMDRNENDQDSFKKTSETLTRMSHDSDSPVRPGFKEALHLRILDARHHKRMSSFSWFHGFSSKLVTGGTFAVVVVVILMLVLNPFSKLIPTVYAQDNFSLVAESEDSLGINPLTSFVLESRDKLDMDFVKKYLKADIDVPFELKKLSDHRVRVTFKEKLTSGQMVRFLLPTEIAQANGVVQDRPYSWVFQVKTSFQVLNTIPGNKTANVPLDAGIEVNFSHENVSVSDFEKAFSVEPALKGHVEKNNRRLVFIPEKLQPSTIYTVTIHKSLHPVGSEESLSEDYVIRFETSDGLNRSVYIHFIDSSIVTVPSEKARFQLNFSDQFAPASHVTETVFTVYRFPSQDSFKTSFQESFVDSWRANRSIKSYVPFDALTSVGKFKPDVLTPDNYYSTYQVPYKLDEGYYGILATWQGQETWAFVQSVSLMATLVKAQDKSLVWAHDAKTKSPLVGAQIQAKDVTSTTDQTGVAQLELPKDFDLLQISSGNRMLFLPVMNGQGYRSWGDFNAYSDEDFVEYMYSDRSVYTKGDTVHVWGFIKPRGDKTISDKTSLRITSGDVEYLRQDVSVSSDHIFSGDITLPDAGSGSFSLGLFDGDTRILSHSIQVQEYRKPIYTMKLEISEKAVIAGDKIHFHVAMNYYDGTPVVGKSVDMSVSGTNHQLFKLDTSGTASGELIASTNLNYANIIAFIDEPGFEQVEASDSIIVYPSSVHLEGDVKIKNNIGTVSVDSRFVQITNGDDRSEDIKTIRPNTSVDAKVIESYYDKIDDGTSYDFIRKSVRTNYHYEYHKRSIQNLTLKTDEKGHASFQFPIPNPTSSYQVELGSFDDFGRLESRSLYAIRDDDQTNGTNMYSNGDGTLSFMSRDVTGSTKEEEKVNFKQNEQVRLEVQQFRKRFDMVKDGSFLFLQAQRGIQEYQMTKTPEYDFTFEERDIPNIRVYGILFTGSSYSVIDAYYDYSSNGKGIGFDTASRKLTVDVQTDADSFRPGGNANVTVHVKDVEGKPVATSVNVSVVDEAYFTLYPDDPNPLSDLYTSVSSGIDEVIVSHENKMMNGADGMGGGGGGDDVSPRSNFVDTGAFVNLTTGNNGVGTTKIRMPDNITSWRFTVQAIDTNHIQAGVTKKNVTTTLPFFIQTAIQPTYLTDDQPEIIAMAQGTAVKQEDKVLYQISVAGTDISYVTETTVGGRAHLMLPKLPEGKQTILIKAQTGNWKDAVSQVVHVVPSRLSIPVVEEYNLADVGTVTGSQTGLTWMTFIDANQGKYYQELQRMSWRYGDRADEVTVRAIATDLLDKTFKENTPVPDVDVSAYQQYDGSIRLLSHADPDPILSAKIALFGEDTPFDELGLQAYLVDRLYRVDEKHPLSLDEAAWVYAGLAAQKKPVFAELKRFEKQDLSKEAQLAIAIAHLYAGDTEGARTYYRTFMKDAKHDLKYAWVEESTPEKTKEFNAGLLVLASGLNEIQDRDGLKDYLDTHSSGQTLVVLEDLLATKEALAFAKPGASKFSYTLRGETMTIELNRGETNTIAVNADELKALHPTIVSGDVTAILAYQKPISSLPIGSDKIGLKRTYTGSFKEGDVIMVNLTYDLGYSLSPLKEYYEITDSVPSGLTPVTYRAIGNNSYDSCVTYPDTDTDQTLSFFVFPDWQSPNCPTHTIRYYARVLNTGTFKAEPAAIRAMRDISVMNFSNAQTVTITHD